MTIDLFFVLFIIFQIVGESAPISSSGHLVLVTQLMQRCGYGVSSLPDCFDDFLHGPMLLVVMIYFKKSWWSLVGRLLALVHAFMRIGCRRALLSDSQKKLVSLLGKIAGMVILADGVTAVFYVLINKWLKHYAWFASEWLLLAGFVVTMISLLLASGKGQGRPLTFPTALFLGVIQGVAQLPGISRFGATVVAARLLGVSPRRSLEFSFLMFFPLMGAAFFIKGLPAVMGHASELLSVDRLMMYALASVASYALFSFSSRCVLTHRLWWFGLYMIVPILVTIGLLAW